MCIIFTLVLQNTNKTSILLIDGTNLKQTLKLGESSRLWKSLIFRSFLSRKCWIEHGLPQKTSKPTCNRLNNFNNKEGMSQNNTDMKKPFHKSPFSTTAQSRPNIELPSQIYNNTFRASTILRNLAPVGLTFLEIPLLNGGADLGKLSKSRLRRFEALSRGGV